MSARSQLVDALTAALPTWRVTGKGDVPDAVTVPTVIVWTSRLVPMDQITRDRITCTLTVWVLSPFGGVEAADDDLDARLVEVLGVLLPLPWLAWTDAERGTLNDQFHGWQVTLTAGLKIGD